MACDRRQITIRLNVEWVRECRRVTRHRRQFFWQVLICEGACGYVLSWARERWRPSVWDEKLLASSSLPQRPAPAGRDALTVGNKWNWLSSPMNDGWELNGHRHHRSSSSSSNRRSLLSRTDIRPPVRNPPLLMRWLVTTTIRLRLPLTSP